MKTDTLFTSTNHRTVLFWVFTMVCLDFLHLACCSTCQGHGGCETAEYLSETLPPQLLLQSPASHSDLFLKLDESILSNFIADHSFFRPKSPEWVHHAQLIKAGSTALLLDIDLNTLICHYSNAGDSRLVICNAQDHQILLQTDDLNSKNVSERERLQREHPNEHPLLINDRLFGRLMSTRGTSFPWSFHYENPIDNDSSARIR